MYSVDITIIGAGVIGLAVAAELSAEYSNILVVEKNEQFGRETSSRNSEVIHSGIYYPEGSLKAQLCVSGKEMLYEFCEKRGVRYKKTGKLIVAIDEAEFSGMEELCRKGERNGVEGLRIVDKRELGIIEPMARGVAALHSPGTGIIDSHGFMRSLFNIGKSSDASYVFNAQLEYIEKVTNGYCVGLRQDGTRFFSRIVINAAGLSSDTVAAMAGIDIDKMMYRLSYFKGSYFHYGGPHTVESLVYPLPNEHLSGLGIHATIDLAGRLRFGPDVEHVSEIDYTINSDKTEEFFSGADRIIRGLKKEYLFPDMAGVRPKLKGEEVRDFIIKHEHETGLEGFINLIGIESPGLTSSLAIAKKVRQCVREASN